MKRIFKNEQEELTMINPQYKNTHQAHKAWWVLPKMQGFLLSLFLTLVFSMSVVMSFAQVLPDQRMKSRKKAASEPLRENKPIRKSFTNPTVPGTLIIENNQGNIQVEGYEGKEVLIIAEPIGEVNEPASYSQSYQSLPFTLEERHNTMLLRGIESFNFRIRVPEKTSLRMKVIQKGNIEAARTSRLVEVDNQNGSVYLEDLNGWAIINTVNGDIDASFREVIANKTMSFIALNGAVHLELPKDVQAQFRLKSNTGVINNDFAPVLSDLSQEVINPGNQQANSKRDSFGYHTGEIKNAEKGSERKQEEYSKNDQSELNDSLLSQGGLANKSVNAEAKDNQPDVSDMEEVIVSGTSKNTHKIKGKPTKMKSETQNAPALDKQFFKTGNSQSYQLNTSYQSQVGEEGPIYFISSRNGAIKIEEYKEGKGKKKKKK